MPSPSRGWRPLPPLGLPPLPLPEDLVDLAGGGLLPMGGLAEPLRGGGGTAFIAGYPLPLDVGRSCFGAVLEGSGCDIRCAGGGADGCLIGRRGAGGGGAIKWAVPLKAAASSSPWVVVHGTHFSWEGIHIRPVAGLFGLPFIPEGGLA